MNECFIIRHMHIINDRSGATVAMPYHYTYIMLDMIAATSQISTFKTVSYKMLPFIMRESRGGGGKERRDPSEKSQKCRVS